MTGFVAGKVAIVTGAGRGIGRAIAMLMAKEGASVVVVDIGAALDGSGSDQGPAQEVVSEIKQAGGKAIASTLSITEPQNAEATVKSAIDAFRRVDILVNNAGILRDRIFHRMSWSDWHDVINVHLNGSFNMARAVAGHFRQANYMAAKLGIHGLARGIALDMARYNVRSNCISPSAWSRMIGSIPTETEQEKQRVERLKQMTPDKIAPLAVYLCSEKAEGISGQIIGVRNNEIFLYSQPRPIRVLHRSDGWTVEKLDAQLENAFKQSFTPLERSGDVLNWDPV